MTDFRGTHWHALRNVPVDYVGTFDTGDGGIDWQAELVVDGRPLSALRGHVPYDPAMQTPFSAIAGALHPMIDALDGAALPGD